MNFSIKSIAGCLVLCALAACGGGEQLTEHRQSSNATGPHEAPASAQRAPAQPKSETESATY